MSEIKQININNLEIIPINSYIHAPIQAIPFSPPVTLTIGNPIIQVPGCVVFNPANEKSINLLLKMIEAIELYVMELCHISFPIGLCS